MRVIRFLFFALLTLVLIYFLQYGTGSLPPLGKLLDPINGFMANAENNSDYVSAELKLQGLHSPVTVYYDDRLVPHIFAQNEHDLYMAQGYIVAKHRLWQMEITKRAASGTLSEILGSDLIAYDKLQRRLGMGTGAENKLKAMEADPEILSIINAYKAGVNAYIQSLDYASLPFEYKLLNFKPALFENINVCYLLMYMSNTLSGFDDDVENTNAINKIGSADFNLLYPLWPDDLEPIVPKGTAFDFTPLSTDTASDFFTNPIYGINNNELHDEDQSGVGSNNWAVAPSKTKNGKVILCNDPHLTLNLPSIWFEIQLTTPETNNYGVCFVGAPTVIIGFNDSIAWGSTNSGRDVRDWYRITANNSATYVYNKTQKPFIKRIENISVKGGETITDTVYYTHHGPMVYKNFDEKYTDWSQLAMRWAAIDSSNDFKVFYLLNKAKNTADYRNAVSYFQCPGQNIVFASRTGDIAITQTGSYAVKWPQQGRFVMDGSIPENEWTTYIPFEQNPYVINPARGYVSSANQHPTDNAYPYFFMSSDFEFFRNRRINMLLDTMQYITVQDMMQLHADNYNLVAADALPIILSELRTIKLSVEVKTVYDILQSWNFINDAASNSPAVFQKMWNTLKTLLWDELTPEETTASFVPPGNYATIKYMQKKNPETYFDILQTEKKETCTDICLMAFEKTAVWLDSLQNTNPNALQWYQYKNTSIMHLAQLPALSHTLIKTGGYRNIVNATSERNGPSWRMIVEMDAETIQAWAIYPGGQSGNPGSKYYDNFIADWANYQYYALQFYQNAQEAEQKALFTTTLK